MLISYKNKVYIFLVVILILWYLFPVYLGKNRGLYFFLGLAFTSFVSLIQITYRKKYSTWQSVEIKILKMEVLRTKEYNAFKRKLVYQYIEKGKPFTSGLGFKPYIEYEYFINEKKYFSKAITLDDLLNYYDTIDEVNNVLIQATKNKIAYFRDSNHNDSVIEIRFGNRSKQMYVFLILLFPFLILLQEISIMIRGF